MNIQAIQNGCHDVWVRVQPYVVRACVVSGVALIVNQLWGNIAAAGFLGGVVVIGVSFPYLVTQFSEDAHFVNLARLVLIIVLPFFGPLGVLGSVGVSTLSSLAQDYRLYCIRGQVDEIQTAIQESNRKFQTEIHTSKERLKEFREKQTVINGQLSRLQAVDETTNRVDTLLGEIKEKRNHLDSILKEHDAQSQTRQLNTAEIKKEIAEVKQNIDELMRKFQVLNKETADIIEKASNALSISTRRG